MKLMKGACILYLILATSCVSYTHIQVFSKQSANALSLFSDIEFSAAEYCRDVYCLDSKSYLGGIVSENKNCDCKDFIAADKSIATINKVLAAYLLALDQLADKNSIEITFNDLPGEIRELSIGSRLSITSRDIASIKDLCDQISSIISEVYRAKKMKDIFQESNESFNQIMELQKKNIEFLKGIQEQQSQEIQAAFSLMANVASEAPLKFLLSRSFQQQNTNLKKINHQLAIFENSLEKIRKGHQQLFEHRASLKDAGFRKEIVEDASGLHDLYIDFMELNKQK